MDIGKITHVAGTLRKAVARISPVREQFQDPDAAMEADRLGDAAHAQGAIESFDWPGDYPAQDLGKLVAGLRTPQERAAELAQLRGGRLREPGGNAPFIVFEDEIPQQRPDLRLRHPVLHP